MMSLSRLPGAIEVESRFGFCSCMATTTTALLRPRRPWSVWFALSRDPEPITWKVSIPSNVMSLAFAASAFSPRASLPHARSIPRLSLRALPAAAPRRRRRHKPPSACAPPPAAPDAPLTRLETAAVALGLPSAALVGVSEAVLLRSGCGLPPGPGGSLGAAEGVAYLVVVGVVGWSLVSKVRTGKGLRPGPGGVLGAVEGLAWLAVLVGIGAGAYVALHFGGLPNAVPGPGERCFPQ